MRKRLDLSAAFQTFEGEPLKNGETDFTLKDALLGYLSSAHLMNLSTQEEATAYEVGVLVGTTKGTLEIDTYQYDLLKKLVDAGKVRQGQEQAALWPIQVSQQAKRLVDAATVVEEKDKAK